MLKLVVVDDDSDEDDDVDDGRGNEVEVSGLMKAEYDRLGNAREVSLGTKGDAVTAVEKMREMALKAIFIAAAGFRWISFNTALLSCLSKK